MSYSTYNDSDVSNTENNMNELLNFKGIHDEDKEVQKYFDCGAHFSYKEICKVLESIVMNYSVERRGISMYEDNIDLVLLNSNSSTNVLKSKYDQVKLIFKFRFANLLRIMKIAFKI